MKFCYNLIRDINFEPDALQPCCNTRALRSLPRHPFSGGKVDMAAYARGMEQALAAMQGDGAMCAGCDQLVELDAPEDAVFDLNIRFRTVSINKHRHICNCRCVYCDLWKRGRDSYAILPALKSLKQQGALRTDCFFSWGGGEPTIIREFEEASHWILDNGYHQHVHSNALRFSPAVADLLARGRGSLNVSLDSGGPEQYLAVKGLDGFAKVTANLARYREQACDPDAIQLKYIVFEKTNSREEMERFFALCRALDIRSVQVSLNFREINAGSLSENTLDAAAYFLYRGISRGLRCEPFAIPDALVTRIGALAERMA